MMDRRGRGWLTTAAAALLIAWLTSSSSNWMILGEQLHVVVSSASGTLEHDDGQLQPPHSVKVEAKAEHSFTLSWQAPRQTVAKGTQASVPTGYSVHWSSAAASDDRTTMAAIKSDSLGEHNVSVPANRLEVLVAYLQPDTEYTVRVAATYSGNRSAYSLPFVVSTLSADASGRTVNAIDRTACDCDVRGTLRCVQRQSSSACVCREGHGGIRCDVCVVGHYMIADGRCASCDCPKLTSSGACVGNVAVERGRECGCHPGHRGADCDLCSGDYFSHGDQCLHCNCLVLCPMDKGRQHCRNCSLLLDAVTKGIETCREFSSHVRLRQQRTIKPSDGTVAVIAVLLSLAFIASVAIGLWCYRNKYQNQNHNSMWSMELHEEKISLNSSCDYQRLDAAAIGGSKRTGGQATTKTDAGETASAAAVSKDRQQSSRSAAHHQTGGGRHADLSASHKYHCISI